MDSVVLECSCSVQRLRILMCNDPFILLDYMVYQLKYDSVHGRFNSTVAISEEDGPSHMLAVFENIRFSAGHWQNSSIELMHRLLLDKVPRPSIEVATSSRYDVARICVSLFTRRCAVHQRSGGWLVTVCQNFE